MEIAGVDTTRHRGKLMLFTPAYHSDTDTAKGGLEWVVSGKPLRVAGAPQTAGKTPIPRDGFVLSYGGTTAPPPLSALTRGTRVELDTIYTSPDRSPDDWARAEAIVGGAGLLIRDGRLIEDWTAEQLAAGFPETRHPRTLIGTHADGSVWLIAVDGRQPTAQCRNVALRAAIARRSARPHSGPEPRWRRFDHDVGAGPDREQPVGCGGAEEGERRVADHATVRPLFNGFASRGLDRRAGWSRGIASR